ncbi:MAG TPA: VOC family protein [Terriglobales bacterium]|nr:VOC family protein [Terriglobales bacterium]
MKSAARRAKPASSLAKAEVMTFVATADPGRARSFYQDTLGLKFVADEPYALVFDLNGIMLRIQKLREKASPPQGTALGWKVRSISAAVKDLTVRGVRFERYPGMPQDDAGVWTSPSGARIAWFKDPDGNTLSLTEFA